MLSKELYQQTVFPYTVNHVRLDSAVLRHRKIESGRAIQNAVDPELPRSDTCVSREGKCSSLVQCPLSTEGSSSTRVSPRGCHGCGQCGRGAYFEQSRSSRAWGRPRYTLPLQAYMGDVLVLYF